MTCAHKHCEENHHCGIDPVERVERFVREMKRPEREEDIAGKVTEAIARPLADIVDVLTEGVIGIIVRERGNPQFLISKKKNGDVTIELTTHS